MPPKTSSYLPSISATVRALGFASITRLRFHRTAEQMFCVQPRYDKLCRSTGSLIAKLKWLDAYVACSRYVSAHLLFQLFDSSKTPNNVERRRVSLSFTTLYKIYNRVLHAKDCPKQPSICSLSYRWYYHKKSHNLLHNPIISSSSSTSSSPSAPSHTWL